MEVIKMNKIYDASTIAKWIVNKIHPEPLKLQKLLYLAQGYSYAFHDRPLFKDELEGWVHGPVVRDVYDLFKNYQYNNIDVEFKIDKLDAEAEDVLNYVIDNFSKYDAKYLEELSHNQDPWILARNGLDSGKRSAKTISKESIENFFINEIFQPELEEWDE